MDSKNNRMKKEELFNRYLSTSDVARILNTNPTSIKMSRSSGMLFGRPAPEHRKIGLRKIVYEVDTIVAWVESAPLQRVVGSVR